MPFKFHYDEQKKYVLSTAYGILDVQEILDELRDQRLHNGAPYGTPGIVDFRQVERLVAGPGLSGLQSVAAETIDAAGFSNVALIVTDPSLIELANMVSTNSKSATSPVRFKVFQTFEDAEAWILANPTRTVTS